MTELGEGKTELMRGSVGIRAAASFLFVGLALLWSVEGMAAAQSGGQGSSSGSADSQAGGKNNQTGTGAAAEKGKDSKKDAKQAERGKEDEEKAMQPGPNGPRTRDAAAGQGSSGAQDAGAASGSDSESRAGPPSRTPRRQAGRPSSGGVVSAPTSSGTSTLWSRGGARPRQPSRVVEKGADDETARGNPRQAAREAGHRGGRSVGGAATSHRSGEDPGYVTVVVSALRPETVFESPRAVEVLTRSRMDELASRSTPELLLDVPGVLVQKTNHGGGSVFLRGFTGQQILYVLDGVRLNNSTTRYGPNQMLNTVNSLSLSRLEVLLGPGSVLYGSDAIGGVVSLWSRTPMFVPGARLRWGGSAVARFSTADRSQVYDMASWIQAGRVAVLVGGAFKDFNDLTGGRGIGRQRWTGYDEGDWDAAVRLWLGGTWFVKVATSSVRQYDVPRTDKCKPEDFRYYRHQFRDLVYARVTGSKGRWLTRFEATVSFQLHREFRERYRLPKDRIQAEFDNVKVAGVSVVAHSDFGRFARMAYGMDLYHDWVGSTARRIAISSGEVTGMEGASFRGRFVDKSRYLQGGLFVTHEMEPWKWLKVRLGARLAFAHASIPADPLATEYGLDSKGIEAGFWGPTAGLSVEAKPLKHLRVIASVQQGFRAPNLDDYSHFGSEGGGFDVPSPDLHKAEKSTTLELGMKWLCPRAEAWVFGHYSFLRDFIARVETGESIDGEPVTVRQNTSSGYVAGVDASGRVLLGAGFALFGWLSWTRGDLEIPRMDPAMQPMRRIPPFQGMLGAGYRRGRWWAKAFVRWAARQDRLSPGDRNDKRICPDGPDRCEGTPGFAILNLAAGVRVNDYASLTLRIENVGNEPYKYHGSGVYGAGTSGILELRIRK